VVLADNRLCIRLAFGGYPHIKVNASNSLLGTQVTIQNLNIKNTK